MNHEAPGVIHARGLVKTYGKGEGQVTALNGVDLTIEAGTVFGLLGANGSGKTTLNRILTTLAAPTAGQALVFGADVVTEAARVRAMIGVIGQRTSLDDRLSGRENLNVLGRLYGLSGADARESADELLEQYGLIDAADRPVATYSGGMRRRLDIVSSLIRRPALLFLDEPTTGLDPRSRSEIWATVRQLAQDGTSVFLTTQYLDEADQLADRVAVLAAGQIIADGTPRDLKARIGQRLTVQLTRESDRRNAIDVLTALGVSGLVEQQREAALTGRVETGSIALPPLLNALTDSDVEVLDIGLSDPTLDEAYLALTKEYA
ncbi:ABC transporter ATP-binding protein [Nocardia sp. NPDC056100]|uniref:ABC transporter ATP-binding protein n=1 Tax=Nocardia sp. NPDC056100 TaxID=3345712 RepID=UPI0035D93C98